MGDMKSPQELLRAIVDRDPRSRSSEGLDDGCFFCGEWQERHCSRCDSEKSWGRVQEHEDDCIWVVARRALNMPAEVCDRGHDDTEQIAGPFFPRREPSAMDKLLMDAYGDHIARMVEPMKTFR